jgi:quercetin dioxygenase-like cupin family protein
VIAAKGTAIMKLPNVSLPTALLMLAGCYPAEGGERPAVSAPEVSPPVASALFERTTADAVQFQQLFPGVSAAFLYGGIGQGVPTFQLATIDAGVTFPAHTHSSGYHAVVVAGRFQHWEEGDADKGPIMTAGSHFYQPGGNQHYDSCMGPEACTVSVSFPERADVSFPQ